MVFLHHQIPSRKRFSSLPSGAPLSPREVPKFSCTERPSCSENNGDEEDSSLVAIDKMVSILADAGCTLLINPSGSPCLPSDLVKLRSRLENLLSASNNGRLLRSQFLAGFSAYINSSKNLQRVLVSSNQHCRSDSLVRQLLLVPTIQLDLQMLLLEKIPEYFDMHSENCSLEEDTARLIINQFRWLDFMVDSDVLCDRLMQIISISPLHLKKEIIGSLPEIIGDQNTDLKTVVDSLGEMLQEESSIIISVLDCFSNLNLDEVLQEQVVAIAMSYIRAIDGQHMPYLLRFLLLSATPLNVRRIISEIREQLKFIGISNSKHKKLKGKSLMESNEASIIDALRTSLIFKNMLSREILKELIALQKPQDHKVIDLWLLMLIYMHGESMQKTVQKILKKKIIDNCIHKIMVDQCICGNKELMQDYFPSFLSLSEYLLACREQKAREFGVHICTCLFEEFGDMYCRQEVLSALIAHLGSGVTFEVNSALEALAFLASEYAQELIPLSTHINGILDYLEGFSSENLHKVYEIFSNLLLLARRSSTECFASSFATELLMIVRKQVSHPDLKYKMMGLIGTLKIISRLAATNEVSSESVQKTNCEEALELLRISLDSCKHLCLPLVLFYDELTVMLEHQKLHPTIMEWISKHVGEFESLFLSDLDCGQLHGKEAYGGLEGEMWMNLDGDSSPICLSIYPLASYSLQSTSLQILPAYFLLLSAVERLANQGSLGGIDALLGCPLHLPSSKYFRMATWQCLTTAQKEVVCLSLFYAINWIRELLNAFCTQVARGFECISQSAREDIIGKLLKRLRNLVFLESLLNNSIQYHPMSLPELHFHAQHSGTCLTGYAYNMAHVENKNEYKKTHDMKSLNKRKHKNVSMPSTSSGTNKKLWQPTIFFVVRKQRDVTNQQVLPEDSCGQSLKFIDSACQESNSTEPLILEAPAATRALNAQRFKFRSLLIQCYSLLELSKKQKSCCSDPAAELPLHLYLLHDLHNKLDSFTSGKQISSRFKSMAPCFSRMTIEEFLRKIRPLFPILRRHFDTAVSVLKEGDETCEEHWKVHSASAGNPDIANVFSKSSVSILVSKEVFHCFSKMLNLPEVQIEKAVLSDLLEAFQPSKRSEDVFLLIKPCPLPGTVEYLYLGAAAFFEDVLNSACSFSFILASESLLTLESIVNSVQKFLDEMESTGKRTQSESIRRVLPTLSSRLGASAQKLLKNNWNEENLENGWKNKEEIVQKILYIYLENSEAKSDLLDELVCSILPQVSPSGTITESDTHGFLTLRNETFVVWYRVLHEVNLAILKSSVRDVILGKSKIGIQLETIEKYLLKIQRSVNVVVSLVSMCRTHDKVIVRAMAVKYGGKFVDSFLKVFGFLQTHFPTHNELIIQLVKELQKATRTIQALCSEAKGLKQIAVTSKIPSTKRSIERFLFHVKALLHTTPSECTFWMGNLKHKDLMGQVVSSQAYAGDQYADVEDLAEADDGTQPVP